MHLINSISCHAPNYAPFLFCDSKIKGFRYRFYLNDGIAKISSMVISLQIMKHQPEITLLVFFTTTFQTEQWQPKNIFHLIGYPL